MVPGEARALVGRDREAVAVRQFVADAARTGGSLLVSGDPGAGKSTLLAVARDAAERAGTRVLAGSGTQFEADVAFAGLHQVLLPLLGDLGHVPEPAAAALSTALGLAPGPPPDRLVLTNAVLGLLGHAADRGALLLVLDDLHWLDQPSLTVIGLVARRVAGTRVGVLGVVRSGESHLVESAGLAQLSLGPLDPASAEALLAEAFPDLDARGRARVLAEAEGNPLALLELGTTGAVADEQALPTGPRAESVGGRLRAHYRRRYDALAAPTRAALLRAALDLHVPAPAGPLEEAERAGLVRVDQAGTRVRFRHPLARGAVVESASEQERRDAHRDLAARWPEGSERALWHLAEATLGPDERTAEMLESLALRTRQRGDPVGAVRLLLRSAALSEARHERERRTRFAAYLGIDVTGDLTQARTTLAALGPETGDSLEEVLPTAATLMESGTDVEVVHRLLLRALDAADPPHLDTRPHARADPHPHPHPHTVVEALYLLQAAAFFAARPGLDGPFRARLRGLATAPATGPALAAGAVPHPAGGPQARAEASSLARAVETLHLLDATFLSPATADRAALARLDATLAHAGDDADHARIARLGMAAVFVDRGPVARPALETVLEHGRAGGAVTAAIEACTLLSCDAVLTGDWERALEVAAEGSAMAHRHGYRLLGGIVHYAQAAVAAARGEHDRVGELTSAMLEWAAPGRIGFVVQLAAHARCLAALGRADHEVAYQAALSICTAATVPAHAPVALWALLDLVEAAVRAGRGAQARGHVADIDRSGVAAISPRLAFVAAAARAIAAPDEHATPAFEAALELAPSEAWPFAQARVRLAFGERLRRTHEIAEARAQLRAAREMFERLHAAPWADRAAAELRASGTNLSVGPAVLTPQQREIALLAARGLTNRQIGEALFLSPRTVATHLYQLFPKLGIASRAALRDALDALRADDPA